MTHGKDFADNLYLGVVFCIIGNASSALFAMCDAW